MTDTSTTVPHLWGWAVQNGKQSVAILAQDEERKTNINIRYQLSW